MKSLKERLEEKIEIECKQYCEELSRYELYGWLYKEGAASLVPLVVELHSALEQYSDGDNTPVATEALQSIDKFLEGK